MDFYDDSSSTTSSSSSSNQQRQPAPSHVTTRSPKRKAGRKKFKETRHPIYHGVRERKGGKWVCEVREPNKKTRIWLGTYPTPEMAARAHDVAAMAFRGKSAKLNFEDSPRLLPKARGSGAEDIRWVATEAAEMFRPRNKVTSSEHSDMMVRSSDHAIDKMKAETIDSAYLEHIQLRKSCEKKVTSSEHTANNMEEETIPAIELHENSDMKATNSNIAANRMQVFVDEEAVFNMPGLLTEMAEGLMVTPPGMQGGFYWDGGECSHMDMSLWNN